MRSLRLLAVAAVALGTVATPAGAVEQVYYRLPLNDKPVAHPRTIEFSDASLTKLRWHHWRAASATARGSISMNTCLPSCAAGHYVSGRISLRAFDKRREGSRLIYGCMTGHLVGHVKRAVEWPPGCAGG